MNGAIARFRTKQRLTLFRNRFKTEKYVKIKLR